MTWIIRDAVPDLDAEACRDIYAPFVSDTTVSFEEQVPTVDEFLGRIRAAQAGHAWLVVEDAGVRLGQRRAGRLRVGDGIRRMRHFGTLRRQLHGRSVRPDLAGEEAGK